MSQSMSQKLALARAHLSEHRFRRPVKRLAQQEIDAAHRAQAEMERLKAAVQRGLAALQAHRDKAVVVAAVAAASIAVAPDAAARDVTMNVVEAGIMIWGSLLAGFMLGLLWAACFRSRQ